MNFGPNHFLETNRLPLLRSVPDDRSDGLSTLGLPFSTCGRSGKRSAQLKLP